ncbi:MAG TPA: ankyrin repeat domain-containing protein, partial [Gemmatimonadaceae bacterium]|nr:ankyrin repeat domain-containing protein [Gemmatimonadaceae bacterium]
MTRRLTSRSSLAHLKHEAKRWLRSLRAGDVAARARLDAILPDAPPAPGLRDVQLALAREHGFAGWTALRQAFDAIPAPADEGALHRYLDAAGRGDVATVAAMLDTHPELLDARAELPGNTGRRTALHYGSGHVEVVRLLLARGANPNVRDDGDDAYPLHFAAERRDLEVIRLLVEHGADTVGDGDMHELSVIGWATVFGDEARRDVVDYLLAHGARHTLFSAVAMDEPAAIRALVAEDPTLLARRMDGTNHRRTALHLAVDKRARRALETLLALGADVEARDAAGLTALDLAALAGEVELARLLIDGGAPVDLPAALALERDDDVARLLREEPDAVRAGGRWATLIVRAAERGSARTIERLVQAGADVNARDARETAVDGTLGYTALHAAAFHGDLAAARALLAHGADVRARESRYGAPPAGWADYAGKHEVRDLILAGDIDPFQAIDFGLVERLPAILQREPWLRERRFGEYVETEPRAGQWWPARWHTPLAWAVANGRADSVRVLLEAGAARIVAPDGRTLRQMAEAAGHAEVVALLDEYDHFDETTRGRLRRFVRAACPDHEIRGRPAHDEARRQATRLLAHHPELAHDGLATAVICGDVDAVRRALAANPAAAGERTGPKQWEPLLYLCFTRLDHGPSNEHAVDIARLLLDHGADPNAHFM